MLRCVMASPVVLAGTCKGWEIRYELRSRSASDRQSQLLLAAGPGLERRERHSEEPDSPGDGEERFEGRVHDGLEGGDHLGRRTRSGGAGPGVVPGRSPES